MAPPAMEDDDARHRREEQERRAKRKAAQRSKTDSQLERDRKRKDHTKKILEEQNKKRQQTSSKRSKTSSSTTTTPSKDDDAGGSSVFQSLFTRRAEGFLIDLNFRNAPPRPPVGPCFVGLGLDGELTDNWTRYRPSNAVETNYTWKLHMDPDSAVPLAPSAMDLEGCYSDPHKGKSSTPTSSKQKLHPDDAALLNWAGSLGDTAAEELQKRRERARAAARLQGANGGKTTSPLLPGGASSSASDSRAIRRARKDHTSRVLDEKAQFWMKKTTYLTNDASRSVHKFTSLAQTKRKTAQEVESKLKQSRNDVSSIERQFEISLHPQPNRKHPTKKGVTPVMDVPLLPDVKTWGHTFTHVVLDAPPKMVPGRPVDSVPSMEQLEHAFVADVQKRKQTVGMVANILVPENIELSNKSADDPTLYEVAQQYDLDVYPLKDEYNPHVNFVLCVDEERGVVTYHPVQSRVQLSMGRPPDENSAGAVIAKRALEEEDVKEMEMRVAEVDLDLARKYGLAEDDNVGVGGGGDEVGENGEGIGGGFGKDSSDEEEEVGQQQQQQQRGGGGTSDSGSDDDDAGF